MTACVWRRFVACVVGLGLALLLVTLLVATEESTHHAGVAPPPAQTVKPERSPDRPPADDTYSHPGLAAWPTP